MAIVVRASVLLAVVAPLFAATGLHPRWWQTFLAAILGSALGQVLWAATRTRGRIAKGAVVALATLAVAGTLAWGLAGPRATEPASAGEGSTFIIVAPLGEPSSLTLDDVRAIQAEVRSARAVAPQVTTRTQIIAEDSNWETMVVGTTPAYLDVRGWHVAAGDCFGDSDLNVVVLGETVARMLGDDPKVMVGRVVRIRNTPFTVVGVLAHLGFTSEGQDLDDVALIPLQTFRTRLSPVRPGALGGRILIAPAPGASARTEAEVRALLRDRHRLGPEKDDDFRILTYPQRRSP